jgi:hypothetical protein
MPACCWLATAYACKCVDAADVLDDVVPNVGHLLVRSEKQVLRFAQDDNER